MCVSWEEQQVGKRLPPEETVSLMKALQYTKIIGLGKKLAKFPIDYLHPSENIMVMLTCGFL